MLAIGAGAITSVFLARDVYNQLTDPIFQQQHQQQGEEHSRREGSSSSSTARQSSPPLSTSGSSKKRNNKNSTSKIHPTPGAAAVAGATAATTATSSSTAASASSILSQLEERGVRIARTRSARILLLLGFLLLCVLLATDAFSAASALAVAFNTSPSLQSTSGIAALCRNVTKASATNTSGTVSLLFSLYLVLQTFCIPGTIALNAVLGALLGTAVGVPACVAAGTIGACCCYTLSSAVGTGFATWVDRKLMDGKGVPKLRAQVNKFRSELLGYLLFLRLTPVLPNWLINLASPVLGVPMGTFAVATLVGITPQTYLSVRFGAAARTLSEAEASSNGGEGKIVTMWDTLLIALVGVMIVVVNKLKSRFTEQQQQQQHHQPHDKL